MRSKTKFLVVLALPVLLFFRPVFFSPPAWPAIAQLPEIAGVKIDADNPLHLKLILDIPEQGVVSKEDAARLVRYFLAALTLPQEDLWVNLSPYEQERVIPDATAATELGEGLLEDDYRLKQLAASLTYPETPSGKAYWAATAENRCRQSGTPRQSVNIKGAGKLTIDNRPNGVGARSPRPNNGYYQINGRVHGPSPTNMFNRVWIAPGKAEIYDAGDRAYIIESRLRVLTESDYLAMQHNSKLHITNSKLSDGKGNLQSAQNTDAFKRHILPLIEKEVNDGKNFSRLRCAYRCVILSAWFKEKLRNSLYKNYIDQNKTAGIDTADKDAKDKIYRRYVEAFKKGAYNIVKTERVGAYRDTPFMNKITRRRYFCGGIELAVTPACGALAPARPANGPEVDAYLSPVTNRLFFDRARPEKLYSALKDLVAPDDSATLDNPALNLIFKPGDESFTRAGDLKEQLGNAAVQQVWIDPSARRIIDANPALWRLMRQTAREISPQRPASMNFRVFQDGLRRGMPAGPPEGFYAYLARSVGGEAILLITGRERYAVAFAAQDFKLALITSEMRRGVSGYGGVVNYVQNTIDRLAQYTTCVVVGWDTQGKTTRRELALGDFLAQETDGKSDATMGTLILKGVKKTPARGFDTVRQAYYLTHEMVEFLHKSHPDVKVIFPMVWYEGGGLPLLRYYFPQATYVTMFHSVQPVKHWKIFDFTDSDGPMSLWLGVLGQMYANQWEAEYAGEDAIISLSAGNEAEILNAYGKGSVTINGNFFDSLLKGESPAFIEDFFRALRERGYLKPAGRGAWRLTPRFERVITAHHRWFERLKLVLHKKSYFDSYGLLTPQAQAQAPALRQAIEAFTRGRPRPALGLPARFSAYEWPAIMLLDYPRSFGIKKRMTRIEHGIALEDLTQTYRAMAAALKERVLKRKNPEADAPILAAIEALGRTGHKRGIGRRLSARVLRIYAQDYRGVNPGKSARLSVLIDKVERGEAKVFFSGGRLSGQKGIGIIPAALDARDSRGRDILDRDKYLAVVVGFSPDTPAMAEVAEALKREENVLFIDEMQSQPELNVLRAIAAQSGGAFLFPTGIDGAKEPFGYVLPEGLFMGLPFIGVKGSGGADTVGIALKPDKSNLDQADAVLIEEKSPRAFAAAMRIFMDMTPEETTRFSAAARAGAYHFDLERVQVPRTYALIYRTLLNNELASFRRRVDRLAATGRAYRFKIASDDFKETFGTIVQGLLLLADHGRYEYFVIPGISPAGPSAGGVPAPGGIMLRSGPERDINPDGAVPGGDNAEFDGLEIEKLLIGAR